MTFGTRLREWIKHSPYTQSDVARITGVSRVTISNYLNDNYEPKREFLEKLKSLGADYDYLMYGIENDTILKWKDSFGSRLADWMFQSGYTQDELAKKTGVNRTSISYYIKGRNEPKHEFFEKLRELGADVGYLINGVATVPAKEEQNPETPDLRLRLLETENKYLREKLEIYEKYLDLDKPKDYNFETLPAVAATPPKTENPT